MNNEQQVEAWGAFHKSTFSVDAHCVEISMSASGDVRVRDSKLAVSPELNFNSGEWKAFLSAVRAGEFDLPE